MLLNILRANPAGNITVFVLDSVPMQKRAEISSKIMAEKSLGAEQVGFLVPPQDENNAVRLEMMGGEFCGNASRSLALYLAEKSGGESRFSIEVSGCDAPITVSAHRDTGTAFAEMPLPREISPFVLSGFDCLRVDFDGISHLVADCPEPQQRIVNAAKALFADDDTVSAYGVIFLDYEHRRITPAVYVKATDSLVWESSCGSGSVAAAAALSFGCGEGICDFLIGQPCGELSVTLEKQGGKIVFAEMGGAANIDLPQRIDI